MVPFKLQCWGAYNSFPSTSRMVVYEAFSAQLDQPCPDDPGPLPVPWTTISDAVIIGYDADDVQLFSYAVMA